ncbi:MAG: acyl-CoA thioesterase [Aminipila sp.]
MKEHIVSHLVKSEDLNHHGTLFAGRTSEWLVEAAFIAAAAAHGHPENILCINVHGFTFKRPVPKGDVFTIHSRVVKVGTTSLTVYVNAISEINQTHHVDGFITFVCVDSNTKEKISHGITMDEPKNEFERNAREKASKLTF